MSPGGRRLDQKLATELSKESHQRAIRSFEIEWPLYSSRYSAPFTYRQSPRAAADPLEKTQHRRFALIGKPAEPSERSSHPERAFQRPEIISAARKITSPRRRVMGANCRQRRYRDSARKLRVRFHRQIARLVGGGLNENKE
jgi:hypothetical protein